MRNLCSIEGCGRHVVGQSLCKRHYLRKRRHGHPLGGRKTFVGDVWTFLDKAIAAEQDTCIEWPFAFKNGYGDLRIDGKSITAHRYVLLKTQGEPPDPNMVAAHAPVICHNRSCINKRHLRWATWQENALDMAIDGTGRQGNAGEGPRW